MMYAARISAFSFAVLLLLAAGVVSCSGGEKEKSGKGSPKDSIRTVGMTVDETYAPILEQEAELFKYHNPKKAVVVKIKPERYAILDLLTDSCKLAIVSRPPTRDEKDLLMHQGRVIIHETVMGYDGIVLVVNKENPIKKLSIEQLKRILSGAVTNWKALGGEDEEIVLVFDNAYSSTVRYIKDSLMAGAELPENVFAAKNNPEVLNYVGNNRKAIGFIGQAWVSDKDSPQTQDFLKGVDKLALKAEGLPDKAENYFYPYQTEIKLGQYPLARRIYCLNRESQRGTGTDFVYFFASDIGQRVLLKAGLLPAFMPPRQISFKQQK